MLRIRSGASARTYQRSLTSLMKLEYRGSWSSTAVRRAVRTSSAGSAEATMGMDIAVVSCVLTSLRLLRYRLCKSEESASIRHG